MPIPQANMYAHLQGLNSAAKAARAAEKAEEEKKLEIEEAARAAAAAKKLEEDEDKEDKDKDKDKDKEDKDKDGKKAKRAKADDEDEDDDDEKKKKKKEKDDDEDAKERAELSNHASATYAVRQRERARCAAIFASPEAANRVAAAAQLAFHSDMTARASIDFLASIPAVEQEKPSGRKNLSDKMAEVKTENLGAGVSGASGAAKGSIAARMIALNEEARATAAAKRAGN